ncbi:MAG: MFS transporter [Hymenobacteraceae bacterium]|nr:MFS transporter [Hymenobacteraceae bacterium]
MSAVLPPPPTRARRAVSALFVLSGFCFATWAARIPDIKVTLHLSEGQLGKLLLALPAGSVVALPLAGWLTDTIGSRRVVMAAAALYALTLPLLGLAPTAWWLAGGLALFGFAGDLLNIAMNAQALEVQDSYGTETPIIGAFHGTWSLAGFGAGLLATGLVGLHIAPLAHFIGVAVLLAALLAVATPALPAPVGQKSGGGFVFRKPDALILRLGFIALCGLICEGTMYDWSGVYFQRVVGASPAWVPAGYATFLGTMTIGRFLSDRVSARLGAVRTLMASSGLIAAGLALAVAFPALPTALLGFALVGAGTAAIIPITYAAAGRTGTVSPAVGIAMVSTFGFFGFLAGPPAIGLLAEWGTLRLSFAVVAVVALGLGVLARYVPRADAAPPPLS